MQQPGIFRCCLAAWLAVAGGAGAQVDEGTMATMEQLFRGKGFHCPSTEDVFALDPGQGLGNVTFTSDGIEAPAVDDSGVLHFRVTEKKVLLGWGNYRDAQPFTERLALWHTPFDVRLSGVRGAPDAHWGVHFWADGVRDGREVRAVVETGDDSGVRDMVFTYTPKSRQRGAPDGFELVIEQAAGSEISIADLQLVRRTQKGCFRKEFTVPTGKVWRAVATVGWQTEVLCNGREIPDVSPILSRPNPKQQTRALDLKPYLQAGRNCIGLKGFYERARHWPYLYFQAAIIMNDGTRVLLDADEAWTWRPVPEKGWAEAGFEGEEWRNVLAADSADKSAAAYAVKHLDLGSTLGTERPAYDGFMVLEKPGGGRLYYVDREPVHLEIHMPRGFEDDQPELAWHVLRYDGEQDRFVPARDPAGGTATTFRRKGDSIVAAVELGRRRRGVYTVQTILKTAGEVRETRTHEPLVVLGALTMRTTDGASYEAGMELELEDTVDFTDADDPHPWMEVDGSTPPKRMRRKALLEQSRDLKDPIVVTRQGLTYRETRPYVSAQFSYKIGPFQHPGDFYLMVLEYPDDTERWMGAACASRWRDIMSYSKIGPSVITGWKFPLSGGMRELKWIYRPDPGPHVVNVINLTRQGSTAAAAKLRIYHIKNGLPALDGHVSGQRWLGILTENCNPVNSFGWTFSITRNDARADVMSTREFINYMRDHVRAKPDTRPVHHVCRRLFSLLDTSEAYTRYLRFTGQNLHVMGCYQYFDGVHALEPRRNIDTSRVGLDLRDMAVRVFRENGISVIGSVEFKSHLGLGAEAPAHHSDGQVRHGADTLYMVDREGRQSRYWNFLHPRVESVMLRLAGEIAARFRAQPNVLGQNWTVLPRGTLCIPVYRYTYETYDPLFASYDDATITRFEQDTGVTVPGATGDPQRFEQRHAFLTGAGMRSRWVAWRCEKTRAFFDKVSRRLREEREDFSCFVSLYLDTDDLREWHATGLSIRDYLRESGWDVALLKEHPNLWVTHWMHSTARYEPAFGVKGYAACWESATGQAFYDEFDAPLRRAQMNMHHWLEMERSALNMPLREGWVYPYQSTMQAQAAGHAANEVFVQGLIGGDPRLVMFGFSHVSLMGGQEQPMREFARVLRSLPDVRFMPVLDTGHDTNLAIRAARHKGQTLWYVANPGYWPVRGGVSIEGGRTVTDLVSGESVETDRDGRTLTVPVTLKPHGVQAFAVNTARAEIVGWHTLPVDETHLEHLKSLVRDGRSVLSQPALKQLLPDEKRRVVLESVTRAEAGLNAGRLAAAWAAVTGSEMWSVMHDDVPEAQRVDPWMVLGPSFEEIHTADGVRYPAWPAAGSGWTRLPGDDAGPPVIGYAHEQRPGSFDIAYAAVEVRSPEPQTVTCTLGGRQVPDVWVNRERVETEGGQAVQVALRAGWNRLVWTCDGGEANGFVLKVQPAHGPGAPALEYRVPQSDLGGPKPSYRVNCGAEKSQRDSEGNVWLADHDVEGWGTDRIGFGHLGGKVATRRDRDIAGTEDDFLFGKARWGLDGYRFHVPNGVYTLRLHFAETYRPGKGRRIFSVSVQGEERFTVDIFAEKGMNAALVKTVDRVAVREGLLELGFKGVSAPRSQEIAAIEVLRAE